MRKSILLVEDEKNIARFIELELKHEQFDVTTCYNGREGLQLALDENNHFDVILLDVMLPELNGIEVCRRVRSHSEVPIILITARDAVMDRVAGLDAGADDYIVKPFSPSEVMARVRAVLRRMTRTEKDVKSGNVISICNMLINLDEYTLHINGSKMSLTKKEIETMWTLAKNPNKVFTRDNLLDSLWGFDYFGDSRTVDSHIKRLRAKLDMVEHPDWNIKTIWGVGYKFEVEE